MCFIQIFRVILHEFIKFLSFKIPRSKSRRCRKFLIFVSQPKWLILWAKLCDYIHLCVPCPALPLSASEPPDPPIQKHFQRLRNSLQHSLLWGLMERTLLAFGGKCGSNLFSNILNVMKSTEHDKNGWVWNTLFPKRMKGCCTRCCQIVWICPWPSLMLTGTQPASVWNSRQGWLSGKCDSWGKAWRSYSEAVWLHFREKLILWLWPLDGYIRPHLVGS